MLNDEVLLAFPKKIRFMNRFADFEVYGEGRVRVLRPIVSQSLFHYFADSNHPVMMIFTKQPFK